MPGQHAVNVSLVLLLGAASVRALCSRAASIARAESEKGLASVPRLVERWLRVFAGRLRASHFVFCSGMLFGASYTWWGAHRRSRRTPHEGVDFARCVPLNGGVDSIAISEVGVPCWCDGRVAGVIKDFICETLILAHTQLSWGRDGATLCSLYAHAHATCRRRGEVVHAGQVACRVAASRTSAPAHLHLSLAWLPNALLGPSGADELSWKVLATHPLVEFLDPLADVDSRLWVVT